MSTHPISLSAQGAPPVFDQKAEPSLPFPSGLTYQVLIDYHLRRRADELEEARFSQQGVSNDRSTINRWMEVHGRAASDLVGDDFGSDFKTLLTRFAEALAGRNRSAQNIGDHNSRLRRWQVSWLTLSRTDGLPQEFGEALKFLIREAGTNPKRLSRQLGRDDTVIWSWVKGKTHPKAVSLPFVRELEAHFGVPSNTLISRLPVRTWRGQGRIIHGQTTWREKLCVMVKEKYWLKIFPPRLEEEWQNLFTFFRADSLQHVVDGKERNIPWRIRREYGDCPTEGYRRYNFSAFFGYLCLPTNGDNLVMRGKGYDPESLTLGLITDVGLLGDYIAFQKLRSGVHTTSISSFLGFCMTLLHHSHGYLKQSPEYGLRLGLKTVEEWHALCAESRKRIDKIRKGIKAGEGFQCSRDSFEPIEKILDLDHPVSALKKFARAVEAGAPAPNCSPALKAQHGRDLFLIKFLTVDPLRIFQVATMTYRADNKGNLYQKPDGSWHVWFPAWAFKNEKGAVNDKPYNVPLPRSIWKDIETYLFVHRPHLAGAQTCDYVFRPVRWGFKKNLRGRSRGDLFNLPMSTTTLTNRITLLSQIYIDDCPGFGAHAFRHIVATEYIKNHKDGYEVTAAILHDSVQTVRKAYARIRPADKIISWNLYYEGLGEEVISSCDGRAVRNELLARLEAIVGQLGEHCSPDEIQAALKAAVRRGATG